MTTFNISLIIHSAVSEKKVGSKVDHNCVRTCMRYPVNFHYALHFFVTYAVTFSCNFVNEIEIELRNIVLMYLSCVLHIDTLTKWFKLLFFVTFINIMFGTTFYILNVKLLVFCGLESVVNPSMLYFWHYVKNSSSRHLLSDTIHSTSFTRQSFL